MKYISILLCALLCGLLLTSVIIANDSAREDRRVATQTHQRVSDAANHTKAESPERRVDNSQHFRLSGTTDAEGGYSTSDNYKLVSIINQPEPLGEQQSENFRLFPGMLAPRFNANTRAFAGNPTLDVEHPDPLTITEYQLYQNAPNPFNPITRITYDIAEAGMVTLKVYNVQGREVTTLVNEVQSQNRYTVSLDLTQFASGIYFYRLHTPNFVDTKKMVLLK